MDPVKLPQLKELAASVTDLKAQLATLQFFETRYHIREQLQFAYESADVLAADLAAAEEMHRDYDAHQADEQRMADIGAYHDMRRDE